METIYESNKPSEEKSSLILFLTEFDGKVTIHKRRIDLSEGQFPVHLRIL
jgi:hypothetical protein